MSLDFHPLADFFPLIEGAEFEALVSSIRHNGLIEPITLFENKILDGRNRYRACKQTGVELKFDDFTGEDPIRFIVSKNVNRRHLNTSQRSAFAAEMVVKHPNGWNQHSQEEGLQRCKPSMTVEVAAELFGVSIRSVEAARAVLREAGTEGLDAIKQGKAFVTSEAERLIAKRKAEEGPGSARPMSPPPPRTGLIPVPEGETLSGLIRKGIALQAKGLKSDLAAKQIGVGIATFRQGRDIVTLNDRDDLSKRDKATAARALQMLDEERVIARPYEIIEPIAERVWGAARGGKERSQAERRRKALFDKSISLIMSVCEHCDNIGIPPLPGEELTRTCKQLEAAIEGIRGLIENIKESRK